MNKRILTIFSVVILSTLIFPSLVLGYGYTRTPVGTEIENPVSFEVSEAYWGSWKFHLYYEGGEVISGCYDNINNTTWTENQPVGVYTRVSVDSYMADNPCLDFNQTINLEYDAGDPIFEIVLPYVPPIQAGFNEYLPDMSIASTTAYIGDLTLSSGPLLWLFMGIPLAFFVIRKTLDLLYPDKIKDRK